MLLNRRVGRAVNSAGVLTGILSAGQDEIAGYQPNGALARRWAPGPAADRPLFQIDGPTGAVTLFRQDRLGSTIAMTVLSG